MQKCSLYAKSRKLVYYEFVKFCFWREVLRMYLFVFTKVTLPWTIWRNHCASRSVAVPTWHRGTAASRSRSASATPPWTGTLCDSTRTTWLHLLFRFITISHYENHIIQFLSLHLKKALMQFWKMHQHGNGKCQHVVRHDATNRAVFSQPFHGLRNRSCYQVTCLWRRIDGCTCVYQVVDHTAQLFRRGRRTQERWHKILCQVKRTRPGLPSTRNATCCTSTYCHCIYSKDQIVRQSFWYKFIEYPNLAVSS